MPSPGSQGLLSGLLLGVLVSIAAATGVAAETLRLAVVAPPDADHLAWAAAAQLQDTAKPQGIDIVVEPAAFTDSAPRSELYVMPVRSLATQVPAFQILELPFFYPSLEALHRRLDGALGELKNFILPH